MIPGDIATRLRQLGEGVVQPTSAIHKLPANLPDLVPGAQFTARIQTPLPDGSYQALVAGRTITLALPHSVKSGDVLELIVTGQQNDSITARLASGRAANDDLPPASLSQTGRLISQLLTGRFGEQRAVPLAGGTPLLPAPPKQAQELAPHLQQAVSNSGLFYESHLRNWAEGSRALASLLSQPHARYMPGKTPPQAAGQKDTLTLNSADLEFEALDISRTPLDKIESDLLNLAAHVANRNPTGDDGASTASESLVPAEQGAPDATNETDAEQVEGHSGGIKRDLSSTITKAYQDSQGNLATAEEKQDQTTSTQVDQRLQAPAGGQKIPEALMPLIYQQLETLATHQLRYDFQAWPGMNVEWEILDPDQGDKGTQESETGENKAWRSTIRLHLPNLGSVDALLVLAPQGLSIRIDSNSPQTAEKMRAAGPLLLEALSGAGLQVSTIAVTAHDSA